MTIEVLNLCASVPLWQSNKKEIATETQKH